MWYALQLFSGVAALKAGSRLKSGIIGYQSRSGGGFRAGDITSDKNHWTNME
jgi:hypothetical protein